MPDETILRILKTAIASEKKGYTTYLEFAMNTANFSGKNVFISLAKDEIAHMELLTRQFEKASEGATLRGIKVERSALAKLIPRLSKIDHTSSGGGSQASDRIALKTAIDLELKARKYYETNAAKVASPAISKLFDELAEMENGHYLVLQNELDSIEHNNFWLNIPEFDLEGA